MMQKKILIATSVLLVPIMIILVPSLTGNIGAASGYVLSNLIYWLAFCLPCIAWLTGRRWENLQILYRRGERGHLFWHLLAFLPVAATFVVAFLPVMCDAPHPAALLIALAYAAVNGIVEELFWRGMYLRVFGRSKAAFTLSVGLFSCWHISLALARGINYYGGVAALLVGAALMGLLWSVTVYRTGTIRYTTIAHILANFFAFSQLVAGNWFS